MSLILFLSGLDSRLDRKNICSQDFQSWIPRSLWGFFALKMYDFSAGSVEIHKMKRLWVLKENDEI